MHLRKFACKLCKKVKSESETVLNIYGGKMEMEYLNRINFKTKNTEANTSKS